MENQPAANRARGMTLIEVLVIIAVVVVLVVLLLVPALNVAKRKAERIQCVNNLMQINVALKVWEGDNGDKYPMQFALTNSETMKLTGSSNAYVFWQTVSNQLSTPFMLHCPADTNSFPATNFAVGFSDANISYFFSLDTADTYPQMILDGDDNLAVNGVRVKPGIFNLPATHSLAWTEERHGRVGNIGMADGSVQQTIGNTLNSAVVNATNGAPVATYRWVIP